MVGKWLRELEWEAPMHFIEISHASRVTKDSHNGSDSMAEKVIATGKVGFVTVRSRTPRRARETFVPPVAEPVTPRRSPCLLAKRKPYTTAQASIATANDTTAQTTGGTVITSVRLALYKRDNSPACSLCSSVVRALQA